MWCIPGNSVSPAKKISPSHREEETGIVFKWVTRQRAWQAVHRKHVSVVTVFLHIIQVVGTIMIERLKEKEAWCAYGFTRVSAADSGCQCVTGSMEKIFNLGVTTGIPLSALSEWPIRLSWLKHATHAWVSKLELLIRFMCKTGLLWLVLMVIKCQQAADARSIKVQ